MTMPELPRDSPEDLWQASRIGSIRKAHFFEKGLPTWIAVQMLRTETRIEAGQGVVA